MRRPLHKKLYTRVQLFSLGLANVVVLFGACTHKAFQIDTKLASSQHLNLNAKPVKLLLAIYMCILLYIFCLNFNVLLRAPSKGKRKYDESLATLYSHTRSFVQKDGIVRLHVHSEHVRFACLQIFFLFFSLNLKRTRRTWTYLEQWQVTMWISPLTKFVSLIRVVALFVYFVALLAAFG